MTFLIPSIPHNLSDSEAHILRDTAHFAKGVSMISYMNYVFFIATNIFVITLLVTQGISSLMIAFGISLILINVIYVLILIYSLFQLDHLMEICRSILAKKDDSISTAVLIAFETYTGRILEPRFNKVPASIQEVLNVK